MRYALLLAVSLILGCIGTAYSQEQSSTATCSPLFANIDGNIKTVCIYVTRKEDALAIAKNNVSQMMKELNYVKRSNFAFILPVFDVYDARPSVSTWKDVVDYSKITLDMINDATKSAIVYAALAENSEIEREAQDVLDLLGGRRSILNEIITAERPLPVERVREMYSVYTELATKLYRKLSELNQKLGPLTN